MNINKLERANILAKSLLPKVDALYVVIDTIMKVSENILMAYQNVTKNLILNLHNF